MKRFYVEKMMIDPDVQSGGAGGGANSGRIGFNISKNNALMAEIAKQYGVIADKITEYWPAVSDILDKEWKGEDQISFKQQLGTKINNLYANSYELADSCVKTLAGLATSWLDFQQKNIIEGAGIQKYSVNIETPTIPRGEPVTVKDLTLTDTDDRGLASSSSFSTIQTTIEDYVNNIKSAIKQLFESIDAGTAFYGSQSSTINNYIGKVEYAITEVVVAIKDMYENVAQLAGSAYTTASQDISSAMDSATTNIEQNLGEGGSRWT